MIRLVIAVFSLLVFSKAMAASDLQYSGFASLIAGLNNNHHTRTYAGYDTDRIDFDPDSIIGFQVSNDFSDQFDFTLQLVAQGAYDWDPKVNWAYLRYKPLNNTSLKLGRLRIPFYLYSDNITLGYSYPWISPPFHVYNLPFNTIDGANLIYLLSTENCDIEFQAYGGSSKFTPTYGIFDGAQTETRNQYGITTELSWKEWKFRYGYHGADLYVRTADIPTGRLSESIAQALASRGYSHEADNFLIHDDFTEFQEVGAQYEDGHYLAVMEAVSISTRDETPAPFDRAYFLTGAYRRGDFLYHLTFSQIDDKTPDLAGSLPSSEFLYSVVKSIEKEVVEDARAWTLGVRWDFVESMAFKWEVTQLVDSKHHDEAHNDKRDLILMRVGLQAAF